MMGQIGLQVCIFDSMLRMLWWPVINKWQSEAADSQIMMYNCNRPRVFFSFFFLFVFFLFFFFLPTCAAFKATERRQRRIFCLDGHSGGIRVASSSDLSYFERVFYTTPTCSTVGSLLAGTFATSFIFRCLQNDSHQTCYCVILSFIEVLVI